MLVANGSIATKNNMKFKYKVNDKVKIVGGDHRDPEGRNFADWDNNGDRSCLGKTATITAAVEYRDYPNYHLDNNKWMINFREEWIKPVSTFAIGDHVKIGGSYTGWTRGQSDIKSFYEDETVQLTNISGRWKPEWLELAPEEVKEEPKKKAYKKGDRFRVIQEYKSAKVGDIVMLDDEYESPDYYDESRYFLYEDGRRILLNITGSVQEVEPIEEEEKRSEYIAVDPAMFGDGIELTLPTSQDYWQQVQAKWEPDETPQEKPIKKGGNCMEIKIGEKYRVRAGAICSGTNYQNKGAYIIVTGRDDHGCLEYVAYDAADTKIDSCWSCFKDADLLPYKVSKPHTKGIMKTLSILAKKTLDKDVQNYVRLEWLDNNLDVTTLGVNAHATAGFNGMTLAEYAAACVKEAEANEKKSK